MTDKELCERLRAEEHWAIERSEAELKREAADRIEALEAALREVFEEWAGSEGFIPETAPEGYLLHLTKRMADIARAALEGTSRGFHSTTASPASISLHFPLDAIAFSYIKGAGD